MDSRAKAEGMVVTTPDIEAIRIGEPLGVSVGCPHQGNHALISLKLDSFHLYRFKGSAYQELDRAVVAKHLLCGRDDQVAVRPKPGKLCGVLEKGKQPVPDQVGSRDEPSEEQQGDRCYQLFFAQASLVVANLD
jgi:hypothetical protein